MTVPIFPVGGGFVYEGQFSQSGVLADPATVTLRILSPSGVLDTYTFGVDPEITKTSVGIYEAAVVVTEPGDWVIGWLTTDFPTASEDRFQGRETSF